MILLGGTASPGRSETFEGEDKDDMLEEKRMG